MKHRTLVVLAAAIVLAAAGVGAFAQGADPGALVSAVAPESPAAKAGIVRGDILLAVDDNDVDGPRAVVSAVAKRKPGDTVELRLSHGDLTRVVTVTLDDREGRPYLGIMMAPPVAAGLGGPGQTSRAGALVSEVTPDSPAAQAGLKPRDVVLSVDGTSVEPAHSLTDLVAGHKPGDTVTLSVVTSGGEPRDVKVTLAGNPSGNGGAYLGVRYGMISSRPDRHRPRSGAQGPVDGAGRPPVTS
jgi:S1-C subfamily serine protease